MTAAKLDPSLCRELAGWATTLSRTPVTTEEQAIVSNRIGTIADQLTAAAELAERAIERVANPCIDGQTIEQAAVHWHREAVKLGEMHNAVAAERDALRAQLAGAVVGLSDLERVVIELADEWLDDPCKGLGSHCEQDLATAVRALRRDRAASLASSFDRATVAVTSQPAAELTAQLNEAVRVHPERRVDDEDTVVVDVELGGES